MKHRLWESIEEKTCVNRSSSGSGRSNERHNVACSLSVPPSHSYLFFLFSGDKSPLSAGTPRHEPSAAGAAVGGSGGGGETGAFSPPSPMRKRLQQVADTALAAGITMPMHTTFEVVRGEDGGRGGSGSGGGDGGGERGGEGEGGMDFVVSVISSEALEAKVGGRVGGVGSFGFCPPHMCAHVGVADLARTSIPRRGLWTLLPC